VLLELEAPLARALLEGRFIGGFKDGDVMHADLVDGHIALRHSAEAPGWDEGGEKVLAPGDGE
jgi:hypothetical protein